MFDFNTFKTTATNRNFLNISSEEKRTYFKGLSKIKEIYYPIALSISKTGHYVFDTYGAMHYIKNEAFDSLSWNVKDGYNHIEH